MSSIQLEELTSIEKTYFSRINQAIDFMEKNRDRSLVMDEVAEAASFSKYHFHRIFQSILGETPFQFLTRIRLERAASMLIFQTELSMTEIATYCGFSDLSIFSRNFKKHFGESPTVFQVNSKKRQMESKKKQVHVDSVGYFCSYSQTYKWKTNMEMIKEVEIKELPEMTVAYVRHVGPYKGDSVLFQDLFEKLMAWAGPRGIMNRSDAVMLSMTHDDPNVTPEDKLRISVCVTIPKETKVEGELGKMEIDGGKYAVGRFEVLPQEIEQMWNWMFAKWLPSSGYQPDDRTCFEMYPEPKKDGKLTLDICIPVRPL